MASCYLVESVSFFLCFIAGFQQTVAFFFLRKTLQHQLLAADPYTILPGYGKVILHHFSAFIQSSKECFLQRKSLPLETGPDTTLEKFYVGKCPAVAERGTKGLNSQPLWKPQQCWLILQSEDTRNLCPGHPTSCREKRPYLTSGQQYFNHLQRKTDMSIVDEKVQWKILAYYSYESY